MSEKKDTSLMSEVKTQLQESSSIGRKLTVTIPPHVVNQFMEKATRKVQSQVNLKGFRPGKAPLAMIKKHYLPSVQKEAAGLMINQTFYEILESQRIPIVGSPEFEFSWPSENTAFEFLASFEIYPKVELKQIEGLQAEQIDVTVTDGDVDQALDRLRKEMSEWQEVARTAREGDKVQVQISGSVAKQEGGAYQEDPRLNIPSFELILGEKKMIEGFEEGLIGVSAGETRELNLKFPSPYAPAADLSGLPVAFRVTVNKVLERLLPALDNAFAEKFGKKDVHELREMIREDLRQRLERQSKKHLEETLVRSLIAANPVAVPQYFVSQQTQSLKDNFRADSAQRGLTQQEIDEYIEKWSEDFEKLAHDMVAAELLIWEIARSQSLEASEEEFENRLQQYAQQTGIELDRVKSYYSEPKRKDQLWANITKEKVLDFLKSKAKLKTIKPNPDQA